MLERGGSAEGRFRVAVGKGVDHTNSVAESRQCQIGKCQISFPILTHRLHGCGGAIATKVTPVLRAPTTGKRCWAALLAGRSMLRRRPTRAGRAAGRPRLRCRLAGAACRRRSTVVRATGQPAYVPAPPPASLYCVVQ